MSLVIELRPFLIPYTHMSTKSKSDINIGDEFQVSGGMCSFSADDFHETSDCLNESPEILQEVEYVTAIHPYDPQRSDEIRLRLGDKIKVLMCHYC